MAKTNDASSTVVLSLASSTPRALSIRHDGLPSWPERARLRCLPGLRRGHLLGAVRCGSSESHRDFRLSFRGWCSLFGGRPPTERMGAASRALTLVVGPVVVGSPTANERGAGSGPSLRKVRTRKGRPARSCLTAVGPKGLAAASRRTPGSSD